MRAYAPMSRCRHGGALRSLARAIAADVRPRHITRRRQDVGKLEGTDLKARRIRVNAISPGTVETPGLSDLLASSDVGEQRRKLISNGVPLGRFGNPDEIAKAVVFLASDDASYITGTELFVDGGFAQV